MKQATIKKDETALFTVYSKVANQSFSVVILEDKETTGKDGNVVLERVPIPKNNSLGGPLVIGGNRQYEEEQWFFVTITRSSVSGSLSIFPVYKDTPDYVRNRLKELAEDSRHVGIVYEDAYQKEKNPEAYAEKKRRKELEADTKAAKEDAKTAKAEAREAKTEAKESSKALKEMQKKLEKYEKEK